MEQIPFDKRSGKIWFNNELVEWQDTKVHVISHGMHYASLVFEGLRVYNKKIFKLAEHTKRLFHSAKIMDMKIPYSVNEINIAWFQFCSILAYMYFGQFYPCQIVKYFSECTTQPAVAKTTSDEM